MTIGICSVAYGHTYHAFLVEWSRAVAALETKPTIITVIHDGISQEIRDRVAENIRVMWIEDHSIKFDVHPQVAVNSAIALTATDWIIKLDADDLILPHALNTLRDCAADVLNFGYRIRDTDHISQPVTAEYILERKSNPIGSCSPFRRWIWEANKFEDRSYDDWVFWIKAARNGATFEATRRVDYVYRTHADQITNRLNHQEARQEIAAL